ncbi:matrixin family metalloprotease [Candidatus Kaiserbacteria bacterium]|nr:matrixin family metalloprotease [Candidatus Kaiserbacteria bacterium]
MLRQRFLFALIGSIVFGLVAIEYIETDRICKTPIYYSLGSFDERFGISATEALADVKEAETLWENRTGRDLFVYDPQADFKINFIFDERQQEIDSQEVFKEKLDNAKAKSDLLNEEYQKLVSEYENILSQYNSETEQYENKLKKYNNKVASYNKDGGAPPDVYEELNAEQDALERQRQYLNSRSRELRQLVDAINEIGQEGNELANNYNRSVETYNQRYGHSEAFTQGDYQTDKINIYTFKDDTELVKVLVHEFGHALGIGHVEGETSIMYYLMEEQPNELELTDEDYQAYLTQCVERRKLFGLFNI